MNQKGFMQIAFISVLAVLVVGVTAYLVMRKQAPSTEGRISVATPTTTSSPISSPTSTATPAHVNSAPRENILVTEGNKITFVSETGVVIKEIPLLKTIPGKQWAGTNISKNKKYIAVTNVYGYAAESVTRGEVIIYDNEGNEQWRRKDSHFADAIPSPNGRYALAMGDSSCGDCPVSLLNKNGIVRAIDKSELNWSYDFSEDGSFFAIIVPTIVKGEGLNITYRTDLILFNESGNELWRKNNLSSGIGGSSQVTISSDGTIKVNIVLIVNLSAPQPEYKEYIFDKQGNQL